jgi:hypothetical protein
MVLITNGVDIGIAGALMASFNRKWIKFNPFNVSVFFGVVRTQIWTRSLNRAVSSEIHWADSSAGPLLSLTTWSRLEWLEFRYIMIDKSYHFRVSRWGRTHLERIMANKTLNISGSFFVNTTRSVATKEMHVSWLTTLF